MGAADYTGKFRLYRKSDWAKLPAMRWAIKSLVVVLYGLPILRRLLAAYRRRVATARTLRRCRRRRCRAGCLAGAHPATTGGVIAMPALDNETWARGALARWRPDHAFPAAEPAPCRPGRHRAAGEACGCDRRSFDRAPLAAERSR